MKNYKDETADVKRFDWTFKLHGYSIVGWLSIVYSVLFRLKENNQISPDDSKIT